MKFGIIALTDSSSIVVAHEKGPFRKFGNNSTMAKEGLPSATAWSGQGRYFPHHHSPARMVANMKTGKKDGYCAGGPWKPKAIAEDIGCTATQAIWKDDPAAVD